MRNRVTHHPWGHSWASPWSCCCSAEQLGCKTNQESFCGRGFAHQPLLQPGVSEFIVWVSPRAAGSFWGQKRQSCASGSSGWEGGCGVVIPVWTGLPSQDTARWPWREPGVGECRQLWPSWELQKLFCPEVGSSSSLLPFPCQSICCPAQFPSPFSAAFQAIEMFDVIPLSTAPCAGFSVV